MICIHIILKHTEVPNQQIEFKMQLHRERDVSDVAGRVAIWLSQNMTFPYTGFDLLYKNQIISHSASLADAGIFKDAKIFVYLEEPSPLVAV